MKKRWIVSVLIIMMLLGLTACGSKGPDVTGKYLCVGESYFDEALQEPYEESWLELKKGGKGTYYSGFEFDLKWKLDGESFTGTVSFLGMEEPMEGTLKDGVIDVKYGDMNIRFVKEGAQAPADGGAAGGRDYDFLHGEPPIYNVALSCIEPMVVAGGLCCVCSGRGCGAKPMETAVVQTLCSACFLSRAASTLGVTNLETSWP